MNIIYKVGDFVIYQDKYLCQVIQFTEIEELFYAKIIEYLSEFTYMLSIGNKISICICSDCREFVKNNVKLITDEKEINRLNKVVIFQ